MRTTTPAPARTGCGALLAELREEPPPSAAPGLVDEVLRTARWQRVARMAAVGIGQLSGMLAEAIRLHLPSRSRPGGRQ